MQNAFRICFQYLIVIISGCYGDWWWAVGVLVEGKFVLGE